MNLSEDDTHELDDDHPLSCINAQIKGLLEGTGADEDHHAVLGFLRKTGLPEGTVKRMHQALVFGDPIENEILEFASTQWGERTDEKVALKACGECGEFAEAVTKIGESRATFEDADKEVGDVLIVLSQWAAKRGVTLAALRGWAFWRIKRRAEESPKVSAGELF